jgi:hypothetical protein
VGKWGAEDIDPVDRWAAKPGSGDKRGRLIGRMKGGPNATLNAATDARCRM